MMDDSNPIPLQQQLRFHPLQQQEPLLFEETQYQMGQSAAGLHVPKHTSRPNPMAITNANANANANTDHRLGKSNGKGRSSSSMLEFLDSFPGRQHFYPAPPQPPPMMARRRLPLNPLFAGAPFQHQPQQPQHSNSQAATLLSLVGPPGPHIPQPGRQPPPPRGTTPIPTFVDRSIPFPARPTTRKSHKASQKRQGSTKSRKRPRSSSTSTTIEPRKCPWHGRSNPGTTAAPLVQNADTTTTAQTKVSYILQLHDMLEDASHEGFDHIVRWQPHGRAFKIYQKQDFCERILPWYFQTQSWKNFGRHLRHWGFCRAKEGADRDAWYHRYFVRGVVVSVVSKLRRKHMVESMQGWLAPGEAPQFYHGGAMDHRKYSSKKATTKAKPKSLDETRNDEDGGEESAVEDDNETSVNPSVPLHENPKCLRGTLLETLRHMLHEAPHKDFGHVVGWLPGGKSFKIHDEKAFQTVVCGKYFRTHRLQSFSDGLRRWGFCRLWEATGVEKDAYYHRLFQDGKPHLCRDLSRRQMLDAMKDFKEEQKRQKEISWSLFPRHREEQHQHQHQQHHHPSSSELTKVRDDEILPQSDSEDELSDDTESMEDDDDDNQRGVACPLIMEPGIPHHHHQHVIPQSQDYLIPYLDLPTGGSHSNPNGNGSGGNDGELDRSMHFGLDPSYQILPPSAMNAIPADAAKKDAPATAPQEINDTSLAAQPHRQLKKFQDSKDRLTSQSYIIRISVLLEDVEKKGQQHIVSWMPHGRAFKIHDEKAFESLLLHRYFTATSLASFHRVLNQWGFQRIRAGRDRRSWYHRLFIRGVTDLLRGFSQRAMWESMQEWRAPGKEPDLYCAGKGDELSEKPRGPTEQKKKLTMNNDPNREGSRVAIEDNDQSSNNDTFDAAAATSARPEKPAATHGDKEQATSDGKEVPLPLEESRVSIGNNNQGSNNDTSDAAAARSEKPAATSGDKEVTLPQPQPEKDPKYLRGTLVENIREMLDVVQEEGNAEVVSWLPHGKAFKIHRPKVFKATILHRFFGVAKYRYLMDNFRSWGFVIFKNGRDKGAFYHKYFLQNQPRLTLHLSRAQMKDAMGDWSKTSTAPDFYRKKSPVNVP